MTIGKWQPCVIIEMPNNSNVCAAPLGTTKFAFDITFGYEDLRIRVSQAKIDAEIDNDCKVYSDVAPQNPGQINAKAIFDQKFSPRKFLGVQKLKLWEW